MSHLASAILFIATIVALSLLPLALGSFLMGLIGGAVCRRFVRGRHLLWILPVAEALMFWAMEGRIDLVPLFRGPLPGWMRVLATGTVMLGSVLAGTIVAALARAASPPAPESPKSALVNAPVNSGKSASDSRVGSLRDGFLAPAEGFLFMMAHPGLWRYAIVPVLLNIAVTLLVLLLLITLGAVFAVKIHPRFPSEWYGVAIEVLAAAGLLLVSVATAIAVGMALNNVLSGHFHARLALHVECVLGLSPADVRDIPFADQIRDSVRDSTRLCLCNLGLLALSIIPVAGILLALPLGCYWNGMVFGLGYLEIPLSLRGVPRAEQRAFARRHRWHTIGLGAAVFAMSLIPAIGSVLLACSSAGAVLLYRRLESDASASRDQMVAAPTPIVESVA